MPTCRHCRQGLGLGLGLVQCRHADTADMPTLPYADGAKRSPKLEPRLEPKLEPKFEHVTDHDDKFIFDKVVPYEVKGDSQLAPVFVPNNHLSLICQLNVHAAGTYLKIPIRCCHLT